MKMTLAQKIGCATGIALVMSAGAANAATGYYDSRNPYTYSSQNDPYPNETYRYDDRNDRNIRYGNVIRCESREQRTVYCGYNIGGSVRLVQRMSQASCIRGRTWGVDRGRLWVSRGCRAQFRVDNDRYGGVYDDRRGNNGYGYGYGNGYDSGNGRGRVLICESRDGRYNFCGGIGNFGQVQIRRQLSDRRCMQNSNWGVRNGGIWVDGGCRAEFIVY